jgi:two-component sensor histidine kinase/CHASE1-domain containing sensor protein
LLATLVLFGGVGVTLLAGWLVSDYNQTSKDQQIELQTDTATYAARVALDRVAIGVQAIRALYASDWITNEQFERFARQLTSTEAIRSLSFYRRVTDAERAQYERRFDTDPARTLGIWQPDEKGEPVTAPRKPVYFVVEAGYLLSGAQPGYGLDVTSLPGRAEAIAEASKESRLIATKTVAFQDARMPGVLLYAPVRDRSGNEIGLAAGSITLSDLSNIARLASGVANIDISLSEPEASAASADEPAAAPRDRRSFEFAGQNWTVVVTPAPLAGDLGSWAMILVVVAGLAATASVLAYLYSLEKAAEVNEARARLAEMLNGLGPLAWLLEPDGTIVSANRAALAAFDDGESPIGRRFSALPFNDDNPAQSERIKQAVAAADRREDVRFDLDMEGTDRRQILDLWIRPLESRGEVTNLVVSAVDVTDRYESEETQRLLMRELDHRMKNTLQVIQAIIRRTAKSHDNVEKFEQSLIGRINAMARAHELLAQERWMGAEISTIIEQESANFDVAEAIRSSGPRIRLNPKAALSFALATHELGTNALKHGALSTPNGRVYIDWSVERVENESRFVLRWKETGGPPVEPPTRQGFGSMLIERSIAYELDGKATVDYRREGFTCTISAPLSAIRPFAQEYPGLREG